MPWLKSMVEFVTKSDQIWMLYVFGIVLFTLILSFLEAKYYYKLQQHLEKTKSIWDDAFAWAVHKPLRMLIWIYGITYAAQSAKMPFTLQLTQFRQVGMVVIVAWFLIRFAKRAEENFINTDKKSSKIDNGAASSIGHLARISILITTGLLIMQVLHINIAPIIAFGGAGTVIVGFAAKDLLANFFGALMIHLDRPFQVGDWIRSPDRNIEGTVEYIGWRLTRIRTFARNPLYVPNAIFTTIAVDNPSRMSNRRIKEVVGLRYQDMKLLDAVTKDIKSMLMSHPEIDTTKPCFVNLNGFGPSSLDILVYTFTKTTQWIPFQGIKQEIMLRILKIIESHGAEMAFPTTTLEVPDGIEMKEPKS